MTGYGRYETNVNDVSLTVEVKSVNHRFCEVQVRLPKTLSFFEEKIKKWVKSKIQRGRIDVMIHMNTAEWGERRLIVDWGLAQAYYDAAQTLKQRFQLEGDLQLQDFLAYTDLFETEENADLSALEDVLEQAVQRGIDALQQMRMIEGEQLQIDLQQRTEHLQALFQDMSHFAPQVQQYYRDQLKQKVERFLAGTGEFDESRLLTEVAVFADKSNIDEELTRLQSHLEQFQRFIKGSHGEPVGRKLDFIIQEMNREINTVGAKAQHVSLSQCVVDVKSELEKMKEQVQNIE